MVPNFGFNGFGEFLYFRTYSRNICKDCRQASIKFSHEFDYEYCSNCKKGSQLEPIETCQEWWPDTIIRVVEGTFSIRKDHYVKNHIPWDESFWQHYARHFAVSMFKMEWLPPGRGLWAMGSDFVYNRGSMALQNCFSGDTNFVTTCGNFEMKSVVGKTFTILSDSGDLIKGTVKSFGRQKVRTYIFKPKRIGKSKFKFSLRATANHRWLLANGDETIYLKEGDVIKACETLPIDYCSTDFSDGFCHGLIFADGHQHFKYHDRFDIRLCGKKIKHLGAFQKHFNFLSHSYPETYGGDCLLTLTKCKENLKDFPVNETSPTYCRGFLEGWLAGDSCVKSNGDLRLDSTHEKAYDWLVNHNGVLGLYLIGHSIDTNPTNFGERNAPLNRFILTQSITNYVVESVLSWTQIEEEVFCLEVPIKHSFTLACGLPTGNCGFTVLADEFENDIHWTMDALMCGVGVGFLPERQDDLVIYNPHGKYDYIIPDTREGWCDSTKALILSYREKGLPKPRFIYDKIRAEGEPIRGFGGICSGPEPLIKFHKRIENLLEMYACEEWYDSVILKTDLANCTGCCVVAGNVRRSAELCAGEIDEVMDLKQYSKYPHREEWGWMSNNSVFLEKPEDFDRLGEIAKRVILNGEPGYINKINLPFGRIGKSMDGLRLDQAIAFNPCGEQPLENKELCTLVETIPCRCADEETWMKALEYATLYASTVTLLPTHRPETNAVMLRNRRIGVGIINVSGWQDGIGTHKLIRNLRNGYEKVRYINKWCNSEAGVPEAIRVTTIKPGGTTPNLPGENSGFNRPNFEYMLRRVRVAKSSPIKALLVKANIPYEVDIKEPDNTDIFEFPVFKKNYKKVSLWEQAAMLVLLQREWSDNAVSNTLNFRPKWIMKYHLWLSLEQFVSDSCIPLDTYLDKKERSEILVNKRALVSAFNEFKATFVFDKTNVEIKLYEFDPNHEEDDIEPVLSSIAPLTKSVAMLPHTAKGVYAQTPEEGISETEYHERLMNIKPIDWSQFRGSDGIDERYCEGPTCEVRHG